MKIKSSISTLRIQNLTKLLKAHKRKILHLKLEKEYLTRCSQKIKRKLASKRKKFLSVYGQRLNNGNLIENGLDPVKSKNLTKNWFKKFYDLF
jgi:hypothetical protein